MQEFHQRLKPRKRNFQKYENQREAPSLRWRTTRSQSV